MATRLTLDEFSVWIGDNLDDALSELTDGRRTLKAWMSELTVSAMEIADTDAQDAAEDATIASPGDVDDELDTDLEDEEEASE